MASLPLIGHTTLGVANEAILGADGLRLLFAAFTEALSVQPPAAIRAVPLQELVQAGLPAEEIQRLLSAKLLGLGRSQVTATEQPPKLRGRRQNGHQLEDGYVLTSAGANLVFQALYGGHQAAGGRENGSAQRRLLDLPVERPVWDDVARELWWGSRRVKQFRKDAANQQIILAKFQENDWPSRIADPLPHRAGVNRKTRLRDAIRSLNTGQNPFVVCFHADGKGGVRWQAIA